LTKEAHRRIYRSTARPNYDYEQPPTSGSDRNTARRVTTKLFLNWTLSVERLLSSVTQLSTINGLGPYGAFTIVSVAFGRLGSLWSIAYAPPGDVKTGRTRAVVSH